jgi:pimeloyl-ACP methyl ester carboxylesterase
MKRTLVTALAVAALMLFAGISFLQPVAEAAASGGKNAGGKGIVYLIRGGLNVFSTGMDELAVKLRARGVNARSIGYAGWQDVARDALAQHSRSHQPIILVGHSFGANAAILMAEQLAASNTPVPLVIVFDPTTVMRAPANVRHLINFYSSTVAGMNLQVLPGSGFGGKLENAAQPEGHLDIDNDPRLHDRVIREILKVVGGGGRAVAGQ